MVLSMDIYEFLKNYGISFERFDHPAVFTCEEAEKYCPEMPGASIKNLFLRDKNGLRHFLVVVGAKKNVDLKKLQQVLSVSKLSFGSPERMQKYLGVEPGSVTLLGLMNDGEHAVEVIIDAEVWGKPLQCHPLVNTATCVIQKEGLEKFFKATGHTFKVIHLPSKV